MSETPLGKRKRVSLPKSASHHSAAAESELHAISMVDDDRSASDESSVDLDSCSHRSVFSMPEEYRERRAKMSSRLQKDTQREAALAAAAGSNDESSLDLIFSQSANGDIASLENEK